MSACGKAEEDTLFLVEHRRDHLRTSRRRGEPAPRPGGTGGTRRRNRQDRSRRQHHLPFSGPARSLSRVPRRQAHERAARFRPHAGRNRHPYRGRVRGRGRPLGSRPGVWIGNRKLCSLGMCVRHWVSFHGFALNVGNDLSLFSAITLCGLHDAEATSLSRECGDDSLSMQEVKDVCTREIPNPLCGSPVAPC